jgi:hypothetical protein
MTCAAPHTHTRVCARFAAHSHLHSEAWQQRAPPLCTEFTAARRKDRFA